MASHQVTSTCPMCLAPVKVAAARCPHCRSWQDNTGLLLARHPRLAFAALLVSAVLVQVLMLYTMLANVFGPSESFLDHRRDLRVVEARMLHGRGRDGAAVAVIGRLLNEGAVDWTNVQIEAQFFDADGRLVDTATEFLCQGHVLAGREVVFKVGLAAEHPPETYASHAVFVRHARDSSSLW